MAADMDVPPHPAHDLPTNAPGGARKDHRVFGASPIASPPSSASCAAMVVTGSADIQHAGHRDHRLLEADVAPAGAVATTSAVAQKAVDAATLQFPPARAGRSSRSSTRAHRVQARTRDQLNEAAATSSCCMSAGAPVGPTLAGKLDAAAGRGNASTNKCGASLGALTKYQRASSAKQRRFCVHDARPGNNVGDHLARRSGVERALRQHGYDVVVGLPAPCERRMMDRASLRDTVTHHEILFVLGAWSVGCLAISYPELAFRVGVSFTGVVIANKQRRLANCGPVRARRHHADYAVLLHRRGTDRLPGAADRAGLRCIVVATAHPHRAGRADPGRQRPGRRRQARPGHLHPRRLPGPALPKIRKMGSR